MIEQLIEIVEEIYKNKDRLFPLYAKMYKSAFDSLVNVGFTKEQSLELLKSMKFTG